MDCLTKWPQQLGAAGAVLRMLPEQGSPMAAPRSYFDPMLSRNANLEARLMAMDSTRGSKNKCAFRFTMNRHKGTRSSRGRTETFLLRRLALFLNTEPAAELSLRQLTCDVQKMMRDGTNRSDYNGNKCLLLALSTDPSPEMVGPAVAKLPGHSFHDRLKLNCLGGTRACAPNGVWPGRCLSAL